MNKLAKLICEIFNEQGHILKSDEVDRIINIMPNDEYNDIANAVNKGDFDIILAYLGKYSDEVLKPTQEG